MFGLWVAGPCDCHLMYQHRGGEGSPNFTAGSLLGHQCGEGLTGSQGCPSLVRRPLERVWGLRSPLFPGPQRQQQEASSAASGKHSPAHKCAAQPAAHSSLPSRQPGGPALQRVPEAGPGECGDLPRLCSASHHTQCGLEGQCQSVLPGEATFAPCWGPQGGTLSAEAPAVPSAPRPSPPHLTLPVPPPLVSPGRGSHSHSASFSHPGSHFCSCLTASALSGDRPMRKPINSVG